MSVQGETASVDVFVSESVMKARVGSPKFCVCVMQSRLCPGR